MEKKLEIKEIIAELFPEKPKTEVVLGTYYNHCYPEINEPLEFWEYQRCKLDAILAHYLPFFVKRLLHFKKVYSGSPSSFISDLPEDISLYSINLNKETPNELRHEKLEGYIELCYKKPEDTNKTIICCFHMRESGNCCGSMTVDNIRIFSPFNGRHLGLLELLMGLIEDVVLSQATTNIIMLNPTKRSFTEWLINKGKYTEIHSFINNNTCRAINILTKNICKQPENTEIKVIEHYE